MELIKNKYKIRCEMGACKNVADYTVKMNRVGIKSRIHVCSDCLKELYELIGSEIIPQSIEIKRGRKSEAKH